ncbi:MAG: 1-acyl-sn-glycerol-3-phosphate acyltransferase [Planctomycetota bacterium]|jgi:1-acyl-sn-glycerol-3-phosphate acyltransferase
MAERDAKAGEVEAEQDATQADPLAAETARHVKGIWQYNVIVNALWMWYSIWFRPKVRGMEHLPKGGRALIIANHASFLDIPLISVALRGRHVAFMARESLSKSRFLSLIMRLCGAILVARGKGDRTALRHASLYLRADGLVTIFAEGTRTEDGSIGEFRKGALLAARMGGAPLVPCALRGTFRALPRGKIFPRPTRLEVEFFAPIDSADRSSLGQAHAILVAALGAPSLGAPSLEPTPGKPTI